MAMSWLGSGSGAMLPSSGRRTVVKQMLYSCARTCPSARCLHSLDVQTSVTVRLRASKAQKCAMAMRKLRSIAACKKNVQMPTTHLECDAWVGA